VTAVATLDARVRAGVAMYNSGFRHAAHDAWEEPWLELATGTDDERFLHGLIQFSAVAIHLEDGNWPGVQGLCSSAREYLDGLPDSYRGVAIGSVRKALGRLAGDPEVVERRGYPALCYEGRVLGLPDLDVEAALVAAPLVADASGVDAAAVRAGVEYAWRDLDAESGTSQFVALAADVARKPDHRAVVAFRLAQHVRRRQHREADVEGLFD
jgi:hypothetical protein